jgi:hypothetical protein
MLLTVDLDEDFIDVAVTQVEPVVQPKYVTDDIWQDIDVFYRYSFADSTNSVELSWQYPRED